MDILAYRKLKEVNIESYQEVLLRTLRKNYYDDIYYHSLIVSSLLHIMQTKKIKSWEVLYSQIMDLKIEKVLKNSLLRMVERADDDILGMYGYFSNDEILSYIIFSHDSVFSKMHEDETPSSINRLAISLLDIKEGEDVADFCSGKGRFITSLLVRQDDIDVTGIEQHEHNNVITLLKGHIIDKDIKVITSDVFDEDLEGLMFDKIFSNYPIGDKLSKILPRLEKYRNKYAHLKNEKKSSSADWLYNQVIFDHLEKGGKAITIMSNSGIWNDSDIEMRRSFLKNKSIEAIISLPEKLFSSISGGVSMIVLSHENEYIRMIDASHLFDKSRRMNSLSDNQIVSIKEYTNTDSKFSKKVYYPDIVYPFNLNPHHYLSETTDEDDLSFSDIVIDIRRGASITSLKYDQLISAEETSYRYLMINNINEGIIDYELPYLNENAKEYSRFYIEKGDLILTKNGSPFKISIHDKNIKNKIIANGNLYIIKVDTNIYDPYFLNAYLMSEQGQNAINELAKGTTIKNISIKDLNRVKIPNIPLDVQREFAKLYKQKNTELIKTIRKMKDLKREKEDLLRKFLK